MTPEDADAIKARASQLQAHDLAVLLVELYEAFFDINEDASTTVIGVLTHRGVPPATASRIHSTITKLTA